MSDEVIRKAEAAVVRARQLDDTLAEAHSAMGLLKTYENDFARAQQSYRRAIELNPNSSIAHYRYAFNLLSGLEIEGAIREMQRAQELVDGVRTKFGNRTIDKLSAARSMLKLLRSGEHALGLLPDLNTLDDEAIFVDFFGVPAATTFVIAKLAVRTGTPLVGFFAPWSEEKGKYLLIPEPPIPAECTGDEEADVRRVTIEITRSIENQIRRFPGQWLWIHKRWKTRPPGEPGIY